MTAALPVPVSLALKEDFDAPEQAVIPNLTTQQAYFMSYLLESDDAELAHDKYTLEQGEPPAIAAWMESSDFAYALSIAHSDRKLLFRGMSIALFGPAFRALGGMLASPKTAGKGVELLARLNGMLIDKVKHESPDELKRMWNVMNRKYPVIEESE